MSRYGGAAALIGVVLCCAPAMAGGQTLAALQGRVFDESGARLAGVLIGARNDATGVERSVRTDSDGRYYIVALPEGRYVVTAELAGFRTQRIEALTIDVGRTLVRDFHLAVGGTTETVTVRADSPLVDRATATLTDVITAETVQRIPLNGLHFTDLGLLVPGSVAPSQTGFSSRPIRGVGTLAFNTSGSREEAVAFLVNGVSTNNLTFGSLVFEPPVASIQEFKVDRSVFAAEHGNVSGAVVNIVTRSGTDEVHGESFEFARNDALDARNYFELSSEDQHPFSRHQFGGAGGGPIRRGRTFVFGSYEGLRQRQGVDLNSLVLSDEQRAAATSPAVRLLLPLIPHANVFDADGTPRFVGSASAVVDMDRFTVDVRHNAGARDRIQAFYGNQLVRSVEPGTQGNSIPGFGSVSRPSRNVLTFSETHMFGDGSWNEARVGRTHLDGGTYPATLLSPVDFDIADGVTRPIGLPQLIVAGGLNFGGPGSLPMGRFDTSYVFLDALSRATGAHLMKFGGEYGHFVNENVAEGSGVFNFPTVAAFLAGTANSFSTTLGERRSTIDQRAFGAFFQDHIAVRGNLTLDLGVRYEWHVTPTERANRFVVFDTATGALVRLGKGDRIYQQNNRNIEPRLGLAWSLSPAGRTVLRAAYGRAADEPGTTAVRDTAGNPPFAVPLRASGAIPLETAIDFARPAGLAPSTVDPHFQNATAASWNVNLQRQFTADVALTAGYSGSRGAHLRLSRNLNQPVGGVLPYATVAMSSAILPGAPLGAITQVESSGFSRYRGAWITLTKRQSRGLQFEASYTWSKSMDTNSLNSSGFAVQDGYDIPGEYGLSDFDAPHRVAVSAIWNLPFDAHLLTRGWQVAVVTQAQSGNPVNIVTSNSMLNGIPNTVRPDLIAPIRIVGAVDRWFEPSSFVAVDHFGNLGRNAVIGPGFGNTDLSMMRNAHAGRAALQFRLDVFDVFNQVNLGPPGNIVGSPMFGKITRTRLPTGEAGSSRQVQLAARVSF